MAKMTARVVLNRAALNELTLGVADGLFELAEKIISAANPPDDTPIGVGLVEAGAAIAFVGRKKVGGTTVLGRQVAKPRSATLGPGVTVIGGYGFPARFQELGTVHQPARPFLTPALLAELPGAAGYIRSAVSRRAAKGQR
jgi:hypothetical protein